MRMAIVLSHTAHKEIHQKQLSLYQEEHSAEPGDTLISDFKL